MDGRRLAESRRSASNSLSVCASSARRKNPVGRKIRHEEKFPKVSEGGAVSLLCPYGQGCQRERPTDSSKESSQGRWPVYTV